MSRASLQAQLWAPKRPRPTLDMESGPLYDGPCKVAMGSEGAGTPWLHRVGLSHSHLVLLALASQEIIIQQCMFPRGLCTQEPRINTQEVLSIVGPWHWAG